ncbi:hypothetical protein [Streptomyces sp. NPDC048659]|uniref:hypothetical protein n=1 Tax=Streptomyces sp. NPDC048659 TaxID=3155489 RepID=UPI00341F869A
MTKTTPGRPFPVESLFPELAPYRARTTRLHPRPGRPGMRDSHVGGPMLWPDEEPWPVCEGPHAPVTEGYAPEEIRRARASGERPKERTRAAGDGALEAVPFIGLAQFFRRDVPGLAAGPGGTDLVQLFHCPLSHDPQGAQPWLLRWRRVDETERAGGFRAATAPPEVPLLPWPDELPVPCVLHPEEVDSYPWAERDTLPAPLMARIDAWDDAQTAAHGPDTVGYQYDLSIPPGWRVGGHPTWASTGPLHVVCEACATPMRLLLTADGHETNSPAHTWLPAEDREHAARLETRRAVLQPTGLRFGRDHDLHVFVCPADPGHPPEWVLS